jgi:hippurate hydrolase
LKIKHSRYRAISNAANKPKRIFYLYSSRKDNPMEIPGNLIEQAAQWRRDLHRIPEIGFRETLTSERIARLLESFDLEVHRGLAGTGVVGTLRNGPGGTLGIRADIDALAMQELGNHSHTSEHTGCMHACGHDGHTAIALATAQYLSTTRNFSGTVHFVFQPAEETLGGAEKMIQDGLFELFPMDAIYGLHNWPGLPAGQVLINPGAMMASLDTFEIVMKGKGCHAAMPHLGHDTIVAGAHLVLALQTIASRCTSPFDPVVLSVTQMNAGEAVNVLPETAVVRGTVRCLDTKVRERVQALISKFVEGLPETFGVTATLDYSVDYPVTQNDPAAAARLRHSAIEALGKDNVRWDGLPSMASEDFSFMLQACPGAYMWLGVDGAEKSHSLHSPYYDFNDDAIETGVSVWARLVETELKRLS